MKTTKAIVVHLVLLTMVLPCMADGVLRNASAAVSEVSTSLDCPPSYVDEWYFPDAVATSLVFMASVAAISNNWQSITPLWMFVPDHYADAAVSNLLTRAKPVFSDDENETIPNPAVLWWRPASHREKDVKPYIRALQLDGNPVIPTDNSGEQSTFWTRKLSRPPLRVGPSTQEYLQRRPSTPSGVLQIP